MYCKQHYGFDQAKYEEYLEEIKNASNLSPQMVSESSVLVECVRKACVLLSIKLHIKAFHSIFHNESENRFTNQNRIFTYSSN